MLRDPPCAGAAPRWPVRRRTGPLLLGAVAVYGLATLAFGISTHFVASLLALVVTGGPT